ncbi:DUF4251 domain-containing protein [Chitinophaga cymbidii]|uniref:DUF4251 domain-containing protein n=1 Tax=Chitinophaga cymbidii TaxID=1096750 RepID=A0A512RNA5_9BACT|nr:DUF4251 domain-containing protein [Chitinophaga cymbidii]GEP97163.1 hypothetical protein CCY01nite_34230 [Chitinophaga cymbidii]
MKIIRSIFVLLIVAAAIPACSPTQSQQIGQGMDEGTVSRLIADRKYVFQAQTVFPMRGRSRQITGDGYDVYVSKDTVISYLPYFGRAYNAPMDPSQGGIQFTSTNFEYKEENGKDGGWNITIKPNDARDVQQFYLTVSKDGYASLQVTSTNRQPISFNGVVREKRNRR